MLCSRTTASSGVTCTNRTEPSLLYPATVVSRPFLTASRYSIGGLCSRGALCGLERVRGHGPVDWVPRPSSVTADPPPRSVSRTRIVVRVETARAGPDESVHGICGRRQSLGGSITPSCTKKSRLSQKLRSSTTLPSSNRSMVTPGLSMVLPVASIPCSAPSCVPRPV